VIASPVMDIISDDPSLDHGSGFAVAAVHSGNADNGRAINLRRAPVENKSAHAMRARDL
jgi:hypothetical protein